MTNKKRKDKPKKVYVRLKNGELWLFHNNITGSRFASGDPSRMWLRSLDQNVNELRETMSYEVADMDEDPLKVGNWIKIKDKIPAEKQKVITYFDITGIDVMTYHNLDGTEDEEFGTHMFTSPRGFLTDDVTHWMPYYGEEKPI